MPLIVTNTEFIKLKLIALRSPHCPGVVVLAGNKSSGLRPGDVKKLVSRFWRSLRSHGCSGRRSRRQRRLQSAHLLLDD